MTLKTTKEQRDELLANNRALLPYAQVSITLQMVHNLCHDADRARELEKELETGRKAWKVLQQKNDDLRAKLDEAYEKAANVCEDKYDQFSSKDQFAFPENRANAEQGCQSCAGAIRALKEQEK